MASAMDDCLFDFDLNFLHQNTKSALAQNVTDRHRKSILMVKKKTVSTDSLIRKYKSQRELLEQNEKSLLASKDECKQVCIDYKSALEKCLLLENKIQSQRQENLELQQKYINIENQYDAIQCHANQLQVLVKEHESLIKVLKEGTSTNGKNTKENKKENSALEKENEVLLKHITMFSQIVFGKKKLTKRTRSILQQYAKSSQSKCDAFVTDNSDDDTSHFDEPIASPITVEDQCLKNSVLVHNATSIAKDNISEVIVSCMSKCDPMDRDSDYSNGPASEDTGRGSSLALSDTDKCFHSPDYLNNDSPIYIDINSSKKTQENAITSPAYLPDVVDTATSPIYTSDNVDKAVSPIHIHYTDNGTSPISPIHSINTSDKSVSPLHKFDTNDIATSPINVSNIDVTTSPLIFEADLSMIKTRSSPGSSVRRNLTHELEELAASPITLTTVVTSVSPLHTFNTDDIATSPINVPNTDVATSPLIFEADLSLNKTRLGPGSSVRRNLTHELEKLAANPITLTTVVTSATSSIDIELNNEAISPKKCATPSRAENVENLSQEKECLELNNSNNLFSDESSESEIEKILHTMRLNHELITPLPSTPARERSEHISCNKLNQNANKGYTCPDAARLWEENKVMQSNIADIAKELLNLKCMLKSLLLCDNNINKSRPLLYNEDISILEAVTTPPMLQTPASSTKDIPEDLLSAPVASIDTPVSEGLEISVNSKDRAENVSPDTLLFDNSTTHDEIAETHLSQKTNSANPIVILDRLQFEYDSDDTLTIAENNMKEYSNNDRLEIRSINTNQKKVNKRLTRLDKFRQKLVPKNKIQSSKSPLISRKRARRRQYLLMKVAADLKNRQHVKRKKNITAADTSATLNDKLVYEKALQVMTDLKLKQKQRSDTVTIIRRKNKKRNEILNEPQNLNIDSDVDTGTIKIAKTAIMTRSRSKSTDETKVIYDENKNKQTSNTSKKSPELSVIVEKNSNDLPKKDRKKNLKRSSIEQSGIQPKRILRSATRKNSIEISERENTSQVVNISKELIIGNEIICPVVSVSAKKALINLNVEHSLKEEIKMCKTSNSVGMCNSNDILRNKQHDLCETSNQITRIQGVLCKMLEKYGVNKVNYSANIPETVTTSISKKIEAGIARVMELSADECKSGMNDLVQEMKSWDFKQFLSGLMQYLRNPDRKLELFNKISAPPAPPMSKQEQILLYIVTQLKNDYRDIVNKIMSTIEYTLFKLNNTPDFNAIESMSHFYAVLCRYTGAKSRLRIFILDAMYCIQFKSVPLIQQCLDVWMHTLPLAHMGMAKTPLITSLVYLLHFYRCDDKFSRVQDLRRTLQKKYFYQITDWNDNQILDMFKNAIKDVKDTPLDKKMLRIALIILAKRQGTKWCQNNLIKNVLLPMMDDKKVPERSRHFCISMIGPLMKTYPMDMKVNCEVAMNQLFNMLRKKQSPEMEEAIYTSLIYMSKNNQYRVMEALVSWRPQQISSDLESLLKDYVRGKPVKAWKSQLAKIRI